MKKLGGFFFVVIAFAAGYAVGRKAQCSTEIEPLDDVDGIDDLDDVRAGENNKVGVGNKINNVINWSFNVNKS